MCQFNLLIIDKKKDAKGLKEAFLEIGFGFGELKIRSLSNQIGENKRVILTTKGHCDCGSILGSNNLGSAIDVKKERKKLKKLKWSDSKIERYIADRLKGQNKRKSGSELGGEMEGKRWIKLADILVKKDIECGILFHQFAGSVEDEEIEIIKSNQFSIVSLKSGDLRNFKENQLNWITK